MPPFDLIINTTPAKSTRKALKFMDEEYEITSVAEPEWQIIGQGIRQFNTQQAGADQYQNLCFVLRASDQEIVGGVIGARQAYLDTFSFQAPDFYRRQVTSYLARCPIFRSDISVTFSPSDFSGA